MKNKRILLSGRCDFFTPLYVYGKAGIYSVAVPGIFAQSWLTKRGGNPFPHVEISLSGRGSLECCNDMASVLAGVL